MKSGKKWHTRLTIILAGVALGYLARFIWPPEPENVPLSREFKQPLSEEVSISELPILPVDEDFELPFPYEIP